MSLIGEDKSNTLIIWNDSFNSIKKGRNSTFFTYTLKIEANDFYAENLTICNSAGEVGQAVALHLEGDRVYFENCRFLGNQDTIYLAREASRHFFNNCFIEGTTDFIFGGSIAIFNECEIKSKKNSFITAASTPENQNYGFVFFNCKLTAVTGITKVYLGRPWRNFASTIFIDTNMGSHIAAEGWHNWNKPEAERTVYYAEYNSIGAGVNIQSRVNWSKKLSENDLTSFTVGKIFNNWVPVRQ